MGEGHPGWGKDTRGDPGGPSPLWQCDRKKARARRLSWSKRSMDTAGYSRVRPPNRLMAGGGERALPSVRPPAQPQPIPKRPRPAPAYQGRARPFKGAVAGGCLVTVGVVKGQP